VSATEVSTVLGVADRLFRAIEDSDVARVEQLFSPGIAVRKSGDERDNDRRRSVRIIGWFIDSTTDRRYEILDRQVFDGGFVQQHILHAHGRNGALVAMRVCIVIKVGPDGLITRIDEYFDPAGIAGLLADRS
jgi:ketosteroid isomerase-like protein